VAGNDHGLGFIAAPRQAARDKKTVETDLI
jgi:hypothetical protein